MPNPFLLTRVLLQFNRKPSDLLESLSAVVMTPDGNLWLGADEFTSIERLSPVAPYIFGEHQSFAMGEFVELLNEDEIDIEGMDYSNQYLWLTGSHSTKRKTVKGKNPAKDMQNLATIKNDPNRYLLARIPVADGKLFKSYRSPENPEQELTAACLRKTETGNALIEALKEDSHLGPFLKFPLPSKENGFDIEGLAVYNDRIFLGFRGPVLRGWAMILELEVEEESGVLELKAIGESGRLYRKHFVNLNGLGVRELCINGEDLLILAGPTMDLEGSMRVFRLKRALTRLEDSMSAEESGNLDVLFDLPLTLGSDHAEGMALFPCLGRLDSLLVVYDSPDKARKAEKCAVYADVFKLK